MGIRALRLEGKKNRRCIWEQSTDRLFNIDRSIELVHMSKDLLRFLEYHVHFVQDWLHTVDKYLIRCLGKVGT